jgi:hypothetical protein
VKTKLFLLPLLVLAGCDDAKKETTSQGAVKPAEAPAKRLMPPPRNPVAGNRPLEAVPAPQVSTVTPEQLQAFGEELQLLEKRLADFEALPPEQQSKEELEAMHLSHRSLLTVRSGLYKGMTAEQRREKLKPYLASMAKVGGTLMRHRLQANRPNPPVARPPANQPQPDAGTGPQPLEGAGEAPSPDAPAPEPEMLGEGNPDPGSAEAPPPDVPPQ